MTEAGAQVKEEASRQLRTEVMMACLKWTRLGKFQKKRSPYVTGDQWDSHGNNHWPMSTKSLVEMLYKMGKNRGTSWLFPRRRPANKIGWRKRCLDGRSTRDTALLIDCIKKRINP
ncbi:hypothetical protein CRENBAI_002000 [Crenichthys baileyi]|uniref:Uncharacterized protein n=1 Tax=Crenichthys baileyi TaxID=28760 RepID=A0AAV9QSL9_9TELE